MSDVGQQCYIPSYCSLRYLSSTSIMIPQILNSPTVSRNLSTWAHRSAPPVHISARHVMQIEAEDINNLLFVPLLFHDETRGKISLWCFISPHLTMYSGPETRDGKFPAIHSPCKCRVTSSTRMENMTVTISIVRRILFKWGHIHTGPCSISHREAAPVSFGSRIRFN